MKKMLVLTLCAAILSGCSSAPVEEAVQNQQAQQSTAVQVEATTTAAPSVANEQGSNGEITLDDAKAIALSSAGISADVATFTKAQKERDDGRTEYEIEFVANGIEYDYEINALDGSVISNSQKNKQIQVQSIGIGEAGAKSAVLNDAGLAEGNVTFTEISLDRDDGRDIYEIEFVSGDIKYNYEVDAKSGTILEKEQESVYN